uniref:HD domain-containing protein n=1 Tax=viral metagenome TaxID=1070528 RepID=A0A6C0JC54_9ZZZZ
MSRQINCPLYGFINITQRMGFIIDTPEFKRLHNLRQLGATYLVYPSANHTRFEHSLGVSHLAKKLLLSLKEKNPDKNITDELIELVQIAGLIHDIGHGPFSHLYDDYIIGENDMEHEERGIEIFKKMVKENTMPFTEDEVTFITSLINPNENVKNNWLFQIVANKYCSIDVDKIDYIQRDSYHLGFGLSEKYERLITMCDIKDFEGNTVLVWPDKLQDEIISLFETRYRLHKKVYHHHTVKSCEYIITDIFNNIISNSNLEFKYLYDDIISFPFTQTIRELKDKLDKRELPKMIGEIIVTVSNNNKDKQEDIEARLNEIINMLTNDGITNRGIMKCKIGFISGNGENPLKNVVYFNKNKQNAYKTENYSSFMAPKNCQEYIYRIYIDNENDLDKAKQLWANLI